MRNISTQVLALIQSPSVSPAVFVSLAFADQTVYVWTGVGSIAWNGVTWLGMGMFGSLTSISEMNNITAQNVTLGLTGIPTNLISEAMGQANQTQPVQIYMGFVDSTAAIVLSPFMVFSGAMDIPSIIVGADTSAISISCENALICLNLASNRTYTTYDQQIDHPGDEGFGFVPSIQAFAINWGSPGGSNPANTGGGAGTPTGTGTGGHGTGGGGSGVGGVGGRGGGYGGGVGKRL